MRTTRFAVDTGSGSLSGWVAGIGPRVLVVHGGPGVGYSIMDDVVAELAARYTVATFQQRGIAPSTEEGEYTIAEAVADLTAVLDGLGWETAYLVGHSWGGHLVLHAAVEIPERLDGVMSVDPRGAVGDGGQAAFDEGLFTRLPAGRRDRARELDAKVMRGEATASEEGEVAALTWPSYFADPRAAPPMPTLATAAPESFAALWSDTDARLPDLEAALPSIAVPMGFLVGERSPMPASAATDTAARIPGAWTHVVPGAGHVVWHESPGCVLAALDRVADGA